MLRGEGWRDPARTRRLAMIYTRDAARNDVTVEVQVSATASTGSWKTVATSTNGGAFTGDGFVRETDIGGSLKTVEVRDIVNAGETAGRFKRSQVTR